MKYVNQLEYPDTLYLTRISLKGEEREKGKSTTIKSSGCGLCSSVMVAHRLIPNCKFELEDALQLSYDAKANLNIGTSYKHYAPAFAEKMNFRLETTSDIDRLRYCLRTGGAAVAHVGGDTKERVGIFSHGGHYITVICEEPDGRLAILDPAYWENKYEEDGRKGKVQVVNDFIALCDGETLKEDTSTRNPSYYLFWRK